MAKQSLSNSKFDLRFLFALIPLAVVGYGLYYFSDIVTYILFAWVISMIGSPIVIFLRKYLGKNLAAGITLGGFVLILILLGFIFIPPISKQARQLAGIDYTQLIDSLEEPISKWEKWGIDKGFIPEPIEEEKQQKNKKDQFVYTQIVDVDSLLQKQYPSNDSTVIKNENITLLIRIDGSDKIEESEVATENMTFFEKAKSNIYEYLNPSVIPKLFRSVIGTLSNFLIALMSVLFIAFFFLKEQGLFNNMLAGVVPDKYDTKVRLAIDESSKMLIRYFIGVLAQVTVITLFVTLALTILGVKNALLIGFFAALMNIIPYVGPIIGATFGAMITISSNIGMPFYPVEGEASLMYLLIKVVAVFGTMQLIDNFIIQPNIFGKSVKAHPLEIFIVVLLGASIGGVVGMVLAIPAYTVVRVIAKVFLSEFKVVQSLTKSL